MSAMMRQEKDGALARKLKFDDLETEIKALIIERVGHVSSLPQVPCVDLRY